MPKCTLEGVRVIRLSREARKGILGGTQCEKDRGIQHTGSTELEAVHYFRPSMGKIHREVQRGTCLSSPFDKL